MFLTETAQLADVVLPAATWGEKTGTFTNADRTVHLSEQAVDPPGEARSDLDIFLDYAPPHGLPRPRRRAADQVARPGGGVRGLEGVLERAARATTAASATSGCAAAAASSGRAPTSAPDGTERLYTDGVFNTDPDYCEDVRPRPRHRRRRTASEYRARQPARPRVPARGRLRAAARGADEEYPLLLTTGRTLYHFHTRTKTGRAPELDAAAPEVWVSSARATPRRSASRTATSSGSRRARGAIEAPARISGIRPGVVFVPFHYGYWDRDAGAPGPRTS